VTPRKLFIAGATGAVGRVVMPLALQRDVDVVAHVRPRSTGKASWPNVASLELADASLPQVLARRTTVVQLIGTMRKRFSAGDTYETSDIGTTRLLVEAAKQAGTVDHVVLLSSVGAGSPRGAYLKAKAEAERLVRDSGLAFTIFRPSAFEDREGQFFPGMRAVTRALGLKRYEPITLLELASAILHVAETRAPLGVALEGQPLWDVVAKAPRA
jgi:uncharacterized protein YbjT (DUF2867 family)